MSLGLWGKQLARIHPCLVVPVSRECAIPVEVPPGAIDQADVSEESEA
jgi:hypothetical protein